MLYKFDSVNHKPVHHLETTNALSFEQTNVAETSVSTDAPIYGYLKGKNWDESICNRENL